MVSSGLQAPGPGSFDRRAGLAKEDRQGQHSAGERDTFQRPAAITRVERDTASRNLAGEHHLRRDPRGREMIGGLRFLPTPREKCNRAVSVAARVLLDVAVPAAGGPSERSLPGTSPAETTAPRISARQRLGVTHLPPADLRIGGRLGCRSMR